MSKKGRVFILFVIVLGVAGVIYFGINRSHYDDLDREVEQRNKETEHLTDGNHYSAIKHKTLVLIIEDGITDNGKPYKTYTAMLDSDDMTVIDNCSNVKDFGLNDAGKYMITVDALKVECWGAYGFEIRKLYDYKKIE